MNNESMDPTNSTVSQNNQSAMPPIQPVPMADPLSMPVQAEQVPPVAPAPVAPAVPSATVDDLQKITQDLQNIAAEAQQTIPAQPVVAAPAVPAPESPQAPVAPPEAVPAAAVSLKATVYSITDCEYCAAEKQYLTSKNIPFVEKNVEKNEADLKEMLAASDNFAGVPVTVLESSTGKKVVVKGFTQSDFEEEMKKLA